LPDRVSSPQVTWINPNGGDWDTASNWSTGALPGPNDDVVINALHAGASITHANNTTDTVNSITAAAPITLSSGTLSLGTLSVAGAFSDSSNVTLSGGTLANATVQAGTILQGYGALSGVTLAGTLDDNGGSVTIVPNSSAGHAGTAPLVCGRSRRTHLNFTFLFQWRGHWASRVQRTKPFNTASGLSLPSAAPSEGHRFLGQ